MQELLPSYHPHASTPARYNAAPVLDRPRTSPLSHGVSRIAAALKYRDFRVLWTGAFASSIGTWMQKVAQSWLVLTLSGSASAFYLGLDSFLGEAPILLFTLIGGVIADRRDKRHLLLMSQYVQMTTAFTLAALVYFDVIRIWHVLTLSVITGMAQAFGGPAHQSLLPALVDKEHMPNAIALNSIQFNLARVIGPLVAGAALTAFGMAACFGLNGVSFLAVILALFSLHLRHTPAATQRRMGEELRTGLNYVRHEPGLMGLTFLAFATTFLGTPLLTFLPLFAQNVFQGGVAQYTELMAFAGAGAVSGALVVAWRGRAAGMGKTLLGIQLTFGVLVSCFALTRVIWINSILLFGAGACMVMVFAMLSSLVQHIAPNDMRGRVMSIYMVAFRGGMPVGSLVAGYMATRTSAPTVLTVNGVLLSLVALWFLLKRDGVRDLT
ncbi:MAG: MFS transporter [Acidobacteria bacterium]|nr:MFS transporter [Acidobacteriota bacterium]